MQGAGISCVPEALITPLLGEPLALLPSPLLARQAVCHLLRTGLAVPLSPRCQGRRALTCTSRINPSVIPPVPWAAWRIMKQMTVLKSLRVGFSFWLWGAFCLFFSPCPSAARQLCVQSAAGVCSTTVDLAAQVASQGSACSRYPWPFGGLPVCLCCA